MNEDTTQRSSGVARRVIVTADDFGLCRGVNEGVIRAHRDGLVTATSLMVRRGSAVEAVKMAEQFPRLALGIHLDLGEWTYREGDWEITDIVVDHDDDVAVAAEVHLQLAQFLAMVGRPPTHIDAHQHAHRDEPIRAIVIDAARRLDIPVRGEVIPYNGGFYGQTGRGEPYPEWISSLALIELFTSLAPGVTEIGCHPGIAVPRSLTTYASEREAEVNALCDPLVRHELDVLGIELVCPASAR